jgi:hypothetical protein
MLHADTAVLTADTAAGVAPRASTDDMFAGAPVASAAASIESSSGDQPQALDSSLPCSLPIAVRVASAARLLCTSAAELQFLDGLPPDTGLASCQLLCSALDSLLPSHAAARLVHDVIRQSEAHGESAFAVALRGAAQAASLRTLCTQVEPSAGIELSTLLGSDSQQPPAKTLFDIISEEVLRACYDSIQPATKLFGFRALEALISHVEVDSGAAASQ